MTLLVHVTRGRHNKTSSLPNDVTTNHERSCLAPSTAQVGIRTRTFPAHASSLPDDVTTIPKRDCLAPSTAQVWVQTRTFSVRYLNYQRQLRLDYNLEGTVESSIQVTTTVPALEDLQMLG